MSIPIHTSLSYLSNSAKWNTEKPFELKGTLQPGDTRSNLEFTQHLVQVQDMRLCNSSSTLDINGFQWFELADVEHCNDENSITRYIEVMENTVKEVLGAESVVTLEYMASVYIHRKFDMS